MKRNPLFLPAPSAHRDNVFRQFLLCLVAVSLLLHATRGMAEETRLPKEISFNEHIRPILTANCTACHGGVQQAGDLSFVYRESVLNVVEPGEPDYSYLIDRVIDEDDETRMPPPEHGPRLSEHQVQLLRKWIEQGAEWDRHWAYESPKRREQPKVSQPDWGRQPMDAFVLAQLDGRGVKPATDERPERWLRRVTLDLIGLPPTLEERSAFLADFEDRGETALETVVDRLLASPRFGERWASVWFDQVRYADSRGQGEDSPRTIWKYRDWVIDAFNNDLPYDQFTIKQLAGDLLPEATIEDRLATAVHRLTHTNEEGGTDDEEFRVAAVLDRVNTTWQTWQATTFGCTQCHSHPYDPFAHDEYYKFAAYFNNTADCDLSDDWPLMPTPIDSQDYGRMTELTQRIDRLTRSLWQQEWDAASAEDKWSPLRIERAKTNTFVKLAVDKKENWDEYRTEGTIANGVVVSVDMPLPESLDRLTGIRVTALPLDPEKALADSEWGFMWAHVQAELLPPKGKPLAVKIGRVVVDEPFPKYDPQQSLNPKSKEGFASFSRIHHPRQAVLVLESPTEVPAGAKLRVKLKHRTMLLAAFPLLTKRAHFAASSDAALLNLLDDELLQVGREKLASLQEERRAIKSIEIPVLREREDHLARPQHVFIRGLFLTKDKQVPTGVPHSLHPDDSQLPDRLAMAEWLVGNENPLTARVAVNRFWARMFGVGLVATEEDFGSTGDPPSHPLLLDDLSVRFKEDYQWSVKKLLREFALSRTYRQSSQIRPELQEADASNRWLARGPRHTLPAETVRDQMLAISGLLSTKMYGEPVQPPLPPGVWRARRGKWKTPKPGDPDRYRRSVYTYVKRSVPFPIFATFDAPSRDFCQPKRLRSNTPLQPLMLMNDAGFVECTQSFAERMRAESDEVRKQIEHGLLAATLRPAADDEVDRLLGLYNTVLAEADADTALRSVARVLLNLDEVITK